MSLQIWLPLKNKLDNYGISSANITSGNITYDVGKFYRSAKFNNSYIVINGTPLNTDTKEFTFCFWLNTSNASATQCIYNGRTVMGEALAVFFYEGKIRFDDGSQHIFSNYNIVSNIWTHYAITRNENQVKLYVNGELKETQTSSPFTCTATYASIGRSNINTAVPGELNAIVGLMNDYRIYDHCLSAREVKEVSKGLLIHYPLNQPEHSPNIAKNLSETTYYPSTITVSDNLISITPNSSDTYFRLHLGEALVSGSTYTISWDSGGCDTDDKSWDFCVLSQSNPAGHIYLKNGYSSCTFTCPSDHNGAISILIDDGLQKIRENSTPVYIRNVKIEKLNQPTVFSPYYGNNTWNDNIEYDTSGFCNHGKVVGTVEVQSNSPRNRFGYLLKPSVYIACGNTFKVNDAITVSLWAYMDTWANGQRLISSTETGGFTIETINNKMAWSVYIKGKGYEINSSPRAFTDLTSGWHLFTGTFDGYVSKFYIDGELESEKTVSTTKVEIGYNANNGLFIHAEAENSADVAVAGSYPAAAYSDFRLYSTALSANDVKELYNTPYSICSNGNILIQGGIAEYGYE